MILIDHLSYSNIIFECRSLVQRLGALMLKYICREQKGVVDAMTRMGENSEGFDQTTVSVIYATEAIVAGILEIIL